MTRLTQLAKTPARKRFYCLAGVTVAGWMGWVATISPAFAQEALSGIKPLSGGVAHESYALTDDFGAMEAQVKAHPDDPEARFLLAVAYSRTPYAERALEQLDIARRLARKSPEGFALFDRKIAEYEALLKKEPDNTLALYRLGWGYYMRGYALRNGYLKRPPAPASPSSPTVETLANADDDAAQAAFTRLVALDGQDVSARNYLGYLLAERDPEANYNAAVALWRASLAIEPENPGASMLLGQAALKKGNLRQAVDYSARALKSRNAWLARHGVNPATLKLQL